jgi:hypothetical protein
VPAFADRGCHVVSVTDPYGHILGFMILKCLECNENTTKIIILQQYCNKNKYNDTESKKVKLSCALTN